MTCTVLPTLQQIEQAAELVHASLPPTPQICWPLLSQRTGVKVWVKHENHQPVGAFKVRGGLVFMHDLHTTMRSPRGVITATRGNHGQSIAFAAARYQIRAVVVVPHGNSREKNMAMRAWGAELVEHGDDFNEAADYSQQLAAERGLTFVKSFHPLLIRGVASYWLELLRAMPDLDAVYVPIGLGSGICAGIAVRNALRLRTQLIGVVSRAAPAYAMSLAAGRVVEHPATTAIADGVAVRRPDAEALQIIAGGVERIVQVSDEEVEAAMRAYFIDTHNVAEGAGAAPLAALIQEGPRMRGRNVGLILCGGNVDHDVFGRILLGGPNG